MKTPFLLRVPAGSANAAFDMTRDQHGKSDFSLVQTTDAEVYEQIEMKLQRVLVNPGLYADKVAEYKAILTSMEVNSETMTPCEVTARAMLDHGDSRVDNRGRCAVLEDDESGEWLVFGYRFG